MSMVKWSIVCKPKVFGALGFKNLEVINSALLMKIGCDLVSYHSNF